MSEENVEAFRRAVEAGTRFDAEALIEELDPEVEWHPALPAMVGGEATVYHGHDGVRELINQFGEVMSESRMEFAEIRDLGDRVLALGRYYIRGKASGAETESPIAYLVDLKNGKALRVETFLDHQEALEAAGQSK
jgi:ketosteroid isomerase-like protein